MAVFPTTGELTDFGGPAENPLYQDGAWAQVTGEREPLQKGVGIATDSFHGDANYSVYVREAFIGDQIEVWGCVEGGQLGAALETWRVTMWIGDPHNPRGYLVYYGGGIAKGIAVRRYDGGSFASFVGIGSAPDGGYPGMLGMRLNGDQVEAWADYGAGWTLVASVTDDTYRGTTWIGIAIEDPTGGGLDFTCFGGGKHNRTQIYRIIAA